MDSDVRLKKGSTEARWVLGIIGAEVKVKRPCYWGRDN